MAYLNLTAPSINDEFATESIKAGCPMLTRSAAPHPVHADGILMRCALGWSIHDQLDCARCAATTAVQDCWRVHPERTPVVSLPASADHLDPAPKRHAAD